MIGKESDGTVTGKGVTLESGRQRCARFGKWKGGCSQWGVEVPFAPVSCLSGEGNAVISPLGQRCRTPHIQKYSSEIGALPKRQTHHFSFAWSEIQSMFAPVSRPGRPGLAPLCARERLSRQAQRGYWWGKAGVSCGRGAACIRGASFDYGKETWQVRCLRRAAGKHDYTLVCLIAGCAVQAVKSTRFLPANDAPQAFLHRMPPPQSSTFICIYTITCQKNTW